MKSLQEWKNRVLGTKIDLDNQSYDCVDVSKSWAEYLTDKPWTQSLSWGNAKDLYSNTPDTYWEHIPAGNVPHLGDIVVMNGNIGGGYGHTGVVVGVDGNNFTIYQQDTFLQCPVYTGVFGWTRNYIGGFLRSKIPFTTGEAPKEAWQRVVNVATLYYRDAPNRAGKLVSTDYIQNGELHSGDVIDLKGFVRGENVDGIDLWFVGRYSGGYAWAGGFSDSSTSGLSDLTPQALASNQRQVGNDVMVLRSAPQITVESKVGLAQPAQIITCKGFVHGQNVDGNDVWFVLDNGQYTWSGGYTNQTTSGLSDLTPSNQPTTPTPTEPQQPTVQYPAATTDPLVTAVINKKHPNSPLQYMPVDLVAVDGGQRMRSEAAAALKLMQAAAQKEGVYITSASGFRDYSTQSSLYIGYVAQDGQEAADTYSARAGYSEHQTGLTMDFSPIAESFKGTKQYTWLMANAHKYGFVLRYPENKVDVTGYMYEPWHWRYVGVVAATAMFTSGVNTLEEYFGVTGGLYADQEQPSTPTPPTDGTSEPTTPPTDETPATPAAPDEAAASATKFVARIGSQLAAAGIVVAGLAGFVTQYTQYVIDGKVQGIATVVLAIAIVIYSQYKYKRSGGTSGWLF